MVSYYIVMDIMTVMTSNPSTNVYKSSAWKLLIGIWSKHNVLVWSGAAWGEGSLSGHCLPLDMSRLAAGFKVEGQKLLLSA